MAEKNSGELVTNLKMETFSDKLGWNWFEYQDNICENYLKINQFLLVYSLRNRYCSSNI